MKKASKPKPAGEKPAKSMPGTRTRSAWLMALAAGLGLAIWAAFLIFNPVETNLPHLRGRVTFTKDVAPIVFKNCAYCHRPGQSAPFSLLTYQDVKKHAQQIAEVTQKRFMPPWLPEPGYGDFADQRILTAEQIGVIQQWVSQGAIEGQTTDLPPTPQWTDGWQLGPPDLVVTMTQPYTLGPVGKDVYRNFVIPIPVTSRRFVQAVEFRPGNTRSVHHAFLRIDRTGNARRLDEQDSEPGFGGMHTPTGAKSPDGFLLGWQPGKVAAKGANGLAWTLEKGSDLVLQIHLQPTGKPEPVLSSVGFYFTDQTPTKTPFKISLNSFAIDIPAGVKDYAATDSYTLPVDVEVLALTPHAHYLGKELQGFATLPDGTRKWLLLIKQWDFNWQGDYRYANPVFLPKASVLTMHYTYDNSTNNVRNPNPPPRRVQYGVQTTDEMGELWLQLLPRNQKDLAILEKHYQSRAVQDIIAYNEYLLRGNPADAKAHNELGKAKMALGRLAEALPHFRRAVEIQPVYDEPHYHLAVLFEEQKKPDEARVEYETTLRINPDHFKAHNNLGLWFLEHGDLAQAEFHITSALRINADDAIARDNLKLVQKAKAVAEKGN